MLTTVVVRGGRELLHMRVPLVHPTYKLGLLKVCGLLISNALVKTNSGFLRLIQVSTQLKYYVGCIFFWGFLCWLNERYIRMPQKILFFPFWGVVGFGSNNVNARSIWFIVGHIIHHWPTLIALQSYMWRCRWRHLTLCASWQVIKIALINMHHWTIYFGVVMYAQVF